MEYVYILKIEGHPSLCKIGKSTKASINRANQLSRQTGSIYTFFAHWEMKVENCDIAEKFLKYVFKEFHFKKEFYNIDPETASNVAEEILKKIFKATKEIRIKKADYLKNLKTQIIGLNVALEFEDDFNKKANIKKIIREVKLRLKSF